MLEAFAIMNPAPGLYKFLFKGYYTENHQMQALEFVKGWSNNKGWTVVKEKRRNIPEMIMFEVKAWVR